MVIALLCRCFRLNRAAQLFLDQLYLLADCHEWLDHGSHGSPGFNKLVPVPDGVAGVAQSHTIIVSGSDLYPLQEIKGLGIHVTSAD